MASAAEEKKLNLVIDAIKYLIYPAAKELVSDAPVAVNLSQAMRSLPAVMRCEPMNTDKKQFTLVEAKRAVHIATQMDGSTNFQSFNPYHLDLINELTELLFDVDFEVLVKDILPLVTQTVNHSAFNYSLMSVLRHRPDLTPMKIVLPSHVMLAPQMYLDLGPLSLVKKALNTDEYTIKTSFDYDDRQKNLEERVSYWRNDPGLNAHHRHWHEAYPDAGTKLMTKKDRHGEIFYYMHSQMVARYNAERLSVKVDFVKPFENLRDPIEEPYFNKLEIQSRAKQWDSRAAWQRLYDVNTLGIKCRIQDMERWRDRIFDGIERGYVYLRNEDGSETQTTLNDAASDDEKAKGIPVDTGIDKLGNMLLATRHQSINFPFYGNLHNMGHILIGYCHDPQGLYYRQSHGSAMTMNETASRDPAFFRWHQFVDDTFVMYKDTLPEYTQAELDFPGIEINSIKVMDNCTAAQKETKTFNTTWKNTSIDITDGIPADIMALLTVKKVFYEFTHLSHDEFSYQIEYNNTTKVKKQGVVRIFLVPIYVDPELKDSLYRQGPTAEQAEKDRNPNFEPHFNKHRRMAIELDKFLYTLEPGKNSICRSSAASSVTIPIKQLFLTVEDSITFTREPTDDNVAWCGCGWPDYLLLPKGTKEGLKCHLFVMVTDYEKDKIAESPLDVHSCPKASVSFCGVKDKKYPDKKPMGFPFDRKVANDKVLFKDFLIKNRDLLDENPTTFGNMALNENMVIKFTDNSATINKPSS